MSNQAKTLSIALAVIVLLLASFAVYFFYFKPSQIEGQISEPHAQNRLIVKFKNDAKDKVKKEKTISGADIGVGSVSELNQKEKVDKIEKITPENNEKVKGASTENENLDLLYVLEFSEEKNIAQLVNEYEKNPEIEYAEPDYELKTQLAPNDPYYYSSGSWGQGYADLWGIKKINSAGAWDYNTGSQDVVVAVIDTGIDYNHSDIANNIWVNNDEIPSNGVDDDGNGYIDDYYGYDFYNGDSDPMDDHAHGTHCAGTIAAVGNNNLGVVGVGWNTKVMAVKFLSRYGSGYYSDAISSIYYAVNNGANVLSNSWGGGGRYTAMQTAIDYAYNNGVVFVAAAGNSNSDAYYFTPAGLDHVVTVAATDYQDNKASFSSWGDVVEVSAPGVDVLSLKSSQGSCTTVANYYCRMSGTSMATPHTAGLAALILANDINFTPDEVTSYLTNNADDLGTPGKDIYFGYGRINSYNSVAESGTPVTHPEGSIIKSRDSATTYRIENGQKRSFPSAAVYSSWSNSWSDVVEVRAVDINSYSEGSQMQLRPGVLVRANDSPSVYLIDGSNRLPISSAQVYIDLGYSWSAIRVVSPSELEDYNVGDSVSDTGSHIDGSLVRTQSSYAVYLLDNGQRRVIPSAQIFNNRYRWQDISVISSSEMNGYPSGSRVGFKDGTLISVIGSPAVYVISNSEKRAIASVSVFLRMGYSWRKIVAVTSSEASNYPTGTPINI